MGNIIKVSEKNFKELMLGIHNNTVEGGYYDIDYMFSKITHDYDDVMDEENELTFKHEGVDVYLTINTEHNWMYNLEIESSTVTPENKAYRSRKGWLRICEIEEYGTDKEKAWLASYRSFIDDVMIVDNDKHFDDGKLYIVSGSKLNEYGIYKNDIPSQELGETAGNVTDKIIKELGGK